jgi:Mg2+ and Co2+ transporter CorA
MRSTVERLLASLPDGYCQGLGAIVLTRTDIASGRKGRRSRANRKGVPLGTYHPRWNGQPAWIELMVDRLDERVLRETATKTLLGRMVALRRRVSKLRALLVAQRDVFYGLSRPDIALITDSGAAPFYEALVNRFQRALDEVERSRDVVVGSFELFTSRTSQQTNYLVKVLTFLTAIVGFCAAIAGLMGMNFKLAFFETGMEGFAMVTGGLLVIAICSVAYARHRDWI